MRARYSILTDEPEERQEEFIRHFYPEAVKINTTDREQVWRNGHEVIARMFPVNHVFELLITSESPTRLHDILNQMNFNILERTPPKTLDM